jgi:hypothetical protein
MKDAALHLESYLPAAGAAAVAGPLDLGVDNPNFSDNWRQGRLRVAVPALPNNTDTSKTITIDLQDSSDGGATFADTAPLVRVQIAGVATTGSAAAVVDCPLPPGLRGPLRVNITVPDGAGDNTAALVNIDWVNE